MKGSWVNRLHVPLSSGQETDCRHCGQHFRVGSRGDAIQCPLRPNHTHEANTIYLDGDWDHKLRLDREAAQALIKTIRDDTYFLNSQGIMDYSLLLGIHRSKYRLVVEGSGGGGGGGGGGSGVPQYSSGNTTGTSSFTASSPIVGGIVARGGPGGEGLMSGRPGGGSSGGGAGAFPTAPLGSSLGAGAGGATPPIDIIKHQQQQQQRQRQRTLSGGVGGVGVLGMLPSSSPPANTPILTGASLESTPIFTGKALPPNSFPPTSPLSLSISSPTSGIALRGVGGRGGGEEEQEDIDFIGNIGRAEEVGRVEIYGEAVSSGSGSGGVGAGGDLLLSPFSVNSSTHNGSSNSNKHSLLLGGSGGGANGGGGGGGGGGLLLSGGGGGPIGDATDPPSLFTAYRGGLRATVVEGPGVYYLGIIDVLQTWTLEKRLENWFKSRVLCQDTSGLSAVAPPYYAKRFRERVLAQLIEGYLLQQHQQQFVEGGRRSRSRRFNIN